MRPVSPRGVASRRASLLRDPGARSAEPSARQVAGSSQDVDLFVALGLHNTQGRHSSLGYRSPANYSCLASTISAGTAQSLPPLPTSLSGNSALQASRQPATSLIGSSVGRVDQVRASFARRDHQFSCYKRKSRPRYHAYRHAKSHKCRSARRAESNFGRSAARRIGHVLPEGHGHEEVEVCRGADRRVSQAG